MSECKYRGKRVDDGEWVHGYYVCYGGAIPNPTHHIIHAENNLNRLAGKNFEINPVTVGQYTGLRGIYEGDIVWWGKEDEAPPCEVFFDDGAFWISNPESDTRELLIDALMGIEVIGNIYENPEMLRQWKGH